MIPFNRPYAAPAEREYLDKALAGPIRSGDGPFTKQCQAWLEQQVGARKALLTSSCTDALEMAAVLLRLQPGDEVIVPSFTFVSTANAFAIHGATPVFCDVRPDTLNLDERLLDALITARTRAVVVVHYGGVACEMDEILRICGARGVPVIEDNAHGLLATYKGRPLGSLGLLATQSFHETKNFGCGEGGALLINAPALIERAEIVREKGTNRQQFFRGQVDKYPWVDVGSSYLPSDLLAAILLSQFHAADIIQGLRGRVWNHYQQRLAGWAITHGVRQPIIPEHCTGSHHLYYLLMPSLDARQAFMHHCKARGILAVFHYQPLHASLMGQRYGGHQGQCPIAEDVADRLIRLPLFNSMSEPEQEAVCAGVESFVP